MKNRILDGHKRKGKKLIPPLKAIFPNIKEISWVNDTLPELVWISFILKEIGIKRTKEILYSLFELSRVISNSISGLISTFDSLTEQEKELLIGQLKEKECYNDLIKGLDIFFRLYPRSPLRFLNTTPEELSPDNIKEYKSLLDLYYDRHSQSASIIQGIIVDIFMGLGKFKIFSDSGSILPHYDFDNMIKDFHSDETRQACAEVRGYINLITHDSKDENHIKWMNYFWNRNKELETPRIDSFSNMSYNYKGKKTFVKTVNFYMRCIDEAVISKWNKIPIDLYKNVSIEVVGALLARQATLAKRISRDPLMWDYHVGLILLRVMVDICIHLEWILFDNSEERAKKFIEYGLGQEKSHIGHLEDVLGKHYSEDLDQMKEWVSLQEHLSLITINHGNWAEGMTAYKMAEESNCKDLYQLAYTPYSFCTHNTWNHIGKYNITHSDNPLHKFMRLPFDPNIEPLPHILLGSAKYLARTFLLIDKKYNIEGDSFNPLDFWNNYFVKK